MAITTNTSFDNRIAQPGSDPILLVEIAADTDWYFSTRKLAAGAGAGYDNYDAIISNDPVLTMEFPAEGFGRAIVSDVEVTVLNADKKNIAIPSDLGYAENAAVVIKFGFTRDNYGNDFLLTNFVTVFTGVVEDYSWTDETLTFNIKDSSFKTHKTLPVTRIKKTDNSGTVKDTIVPDVLIDLGYPVTYGTFSGRHKALGYVTRQKAPGQVFSFAAASNAAGNIVNSVITEVYVWFTDRFVRVYAELQAGDAEYAVSADNEKVTFNDTTNLKAPEGLLYLSYMSIPLGWYENHIDDTANSGQNAIDGNFLVGAEIPVVAANNIGYMIFRMENFNFKGIITTLYLLVEAGLGGAGTGNGEKVYFSIDETFAGTGALPSDGFFFLEEGVTDAFDNINAMDDAEVDANYATHDGNMVDTLARGICGFYMIASVGTETLTFTVMEFKIRIDFSLDFYEIPKMQAFADMAGLEFGSWVDTSPGARDNGFNATDLIDCPPYVIESILRDELGVADAGIDYASFDVLGNTTDGTIKDWLFAGQVIDDIDSAKLIDMLCKLCMARNFKRANGSETLQARNPSASIQENFNAGNMWNITRGRAPLSKVRNEFYVEYGYNPASKKCEKLKFVTASENNFDAGGAGYETQCSDSQTNYATTETLRIKAKWINDDATAEAYCKALADYYTLRNYCCTFRTYPRFGFPLEINDSIDIVDTWFPSTVQGLTKNWEIMKIRKSLTYVEIYAESMIDDY